MSRRLAWTVLTAALWLAGTSMAEAQYFGPNKVQYRTFDFRILATDHFDIYYYQEEAEAAGIVARLAERWYARLSRFFGHQLRGRQPLILYAVPAHFQQTNAIEGLIGEGTGGVTESLRRRIVLPMAGSLADTDHVLGHELVHAFQFDITGADVRETSAGAPAILGYPLWFSEGMAEYLSLGPVDAQTSMWLRDAALREKLPKIRDLDHPRYFPYRWGHAFWAYIGARYGDRTVASLVRSAANPRDDLPGLARQLGTDPDTLTADWHRAILESAQIVAAGLPSLESGVRPVIGRRTGAGRFNVGPQISPDGTEIAFFSERDKFAIDLFLADAATGRVERKLLQTATDPHFDSLEFLTSAGAWSPDGRAFAVAASRGGRPVVVLLDPRTARVVREVDLSGLDHAIGPAFSPDGRQIVVSGNRGGLIDLYLLTLETGALERLTSDPFADLEATFTPDGRSLVFVTERYTADLETLALGPLQLARLDLATRAVTPLPALRRGKHLGPQVSADGRTLTFIAEPDGVSNLYRMPIDGGPVSQLTWFATGVAGITAASPALSAARDTGRLAFSVFEDDGQTIYVLDETDVFHLVAPGATSGGAAIAGRRDAGGDVERYLADATRGLPPAEARPESRPYEQRFQLDAIGQPTISASVGAFGARAVGSVGAAFSDMLGDRLLYATGQVGGSFADWGGQIAYLNRRHRWNWAVSLDATPFLLGFLSAERDPVTRNVTVTEYRQRQTSRGPSAMTAYPFNRALRVEFAGDLRKVTLSEETRTAVFDPQGNVLSQQRERVVPAGPFHLAEGRVALVHDTSYFGATGPVFGKRYRLEVGKSAGTLSYTSLLADWRRYFMPARPVTFAVRAVHYGRYGADAEQEHLAPVFLGFQELVRGYGVGSFSTAECQPPVLITRCAVFEQLIGSRMVVLNLEARAPLVGLFRRDLQYGRVPVEVAAFVDAGLAWTKGTKPAFLGGTREPIRSAGAAARINPLGWFVVEISAARALDRLDHKWQWQVGFRPSF
jgi:Tol biopolymer transport system component